MRYKSNPFSEGFSSVVTDLKALGNELVEDYWNVIEHTDFPFISLTSTTNGARNFPPYDIVEQSDGKVRLQLAIAGYEKDRLTVELEGNLLIVKGSAKKPDCELGKGSQLFDRAYRYQGISQAAFLRTFDMNVYTIIESVELKDGILSVLVSNQKPEEKKRTSFPIK